VFYAFTFVLYDKYLLTYLLTKPFGRNLCTIECLRRSNEQGWVSHCGAKCRAEGFTDIRDLEETWDCRMQKISYRHFLPFEHNARNVTDRQTDRQTSDRPQNRNIDRDRQNRLSAMSPKSKTSQ